MSQVNNNPWGYSLALDIKCCDPVIMRNRESIENYVITLCKLIRMTRFEECKIVHFGTGNKEGYSMVQLIETSNITGHFANDLNAIFIDIFSCKLFNPKLVEEFTMDYFVGKECSSHFMCRV